MKNRLDLELAKIKNITRSQAQKMIENNLVTVNGLYCNKSKKNIDSSDLIEIKKNDLKKIKDINKYHLFNIDIKYENNNFLIVNKPSGQLTHPTSYNEENTLVSTIKNQYLKNIFIQNHERAGIVHRLDKDTSGLIIVAKNIVSYNLLIEMIKNNNIKRFYVALIHGNLKSNIVKVDAPIIRKKETSQWEVSTDYNAKNCITIFYKNTSYNKFSLIDCELETGRTHQIRVHLKYIKNNIINDPIYGKNNKTTKYNQYLCANKISFIDPHNKKNIDVVLDLPIEFEKFIKRNK